MNKDLRAVRIAWLLPVAVLSLFLFQCWDSPHLAVGKWDAEDASVSFYEDGLASLNGQGARWKEIDDKSIRVETENVIYEFSITREDDSSMFGVFTQGGEEVHNFLTGKPIRYKKVADRS